MNGCSYTPQNLAEIGPTILLRLLLTLFPLAHLNKPQKRLIVHVVNLTGISQFFVINQDYNWSNFKLNYLELALELIK